MNPGVKMMLLTRRSDSDESRMNYGRMNHGNGRDGDRVEYNSRNYTREEHEEPVILYGPDSRFHDRRGREHYDSGRYAPRSEYPDWMEPESRRDSRGRFTSGYDGGVYSGWNMPPYVPPVYETDMRYRGNRPMNRIGFAMDGEIGRAEEFRRDYPMEAGYGHMNEMEHRPGVRSEQGYAREEGMPMSKEMAESWVIGMKNEDGTTGPHWSLDQCKQVQAQRNIEADPWDFFVVLNMMYSDYCKVFRKFGVGDKMDFYVDMTKAFLNDTDAQPGKVARYYEAIVKH